MAEVIRMPLLSDTMTEGKIVTWNKKVGDKVKSDDVLADVETDKGTMEGVGYADGTLLYIGVPAGKKAKIKMPANHSATIPMTPRCPQYHSWFNPCLTSVIRLNPAPWLPTYQFLWPLQKLMLPTYRLVW